MMKSKNIAPSKSNSNKAHIQELDSSQDKFCSINDGSVRLLAPAGSGKTHSLLHRCKALAERSDKTKPRFIVFTFTRAARDELRDRIRNNPAFKDVASLLTVTTLNSWGFKLVKSATTNPKLITTSKDRYFCIQNVLQPIWQNYPIIKSLLEDNRRKNKTGQDLLNLMDFLKSMGFRHNAASAKKDFDAQIKYLVDCGMENQLEGFAQRLMDMDIIQAQEIGRASCRERV